MRSLLLAITLLLAGCQSTYYASMEQIGVHKRDILLDRVEAARDGQQAASKQFGHALQRYLQLAESQHGNPAERYQTLNIQYLESAKQADILHRRIAAMDDVAAAMFSDWEKELGHYSSASMRMEAASSLQRSRQDYARLKSRMQTAAKHMQPALDLLHDQVLYLKHNPHDSAIGTLRNQYHNLQGKVDQLQADMQSAISEADSFIRSQQAGQ